MSAYIVENSLYITHKSPKSNSNRYAMPLLNMAVFLFVPLSEFFFWGKTFYLILLKINKDLWEKLDWGVGTGS